MSEKAFKELTEISKEVFLINSSAAILGWDERTYMPKNGSQHRADQMAYLAGLSHVKSTDPHVGELLSELESSDLVNDSLTEAAVNIREIRHDYDKSTKVPKELVEKIAHAETKGQSVWVEARAKSDFSLFKGTLDHVIDLKKQYADAVGYKEKQYDALLDDYEPGATTKSVDKVFSAFRPELVDLVSKIAHAPKKPDISILTQNYPVDKQAEFGEGVAAAIGFDLNSGRLDITDHPFCSGIGPGDCRITTRYNPNHFGQALFGIMHEAGHGMYEQGLPKEFSGTPMADSVSLGIHESQSRMWENMVGRSKSFWKAFFPRAQKTFAGNLDKVSFDDFYFAINDVRPSLIRVEADEVTYNLHILLRFEMEQAIFDGDLKTEDIPAIWDEKFDSYFGIKPKNVAEGCLQDIHWSAGLFGYFPTYALGNLFSAQFFAKAEKDIPDLHQQFENGKYDALLNWLRKNIHSQGRRYEAEKLVEVVTGESLNHEYLMKYLKDKFSPLYGI